MTYTYKCKVCNHEFDAEQKIVDVPLTECPKCRTCALKRLISGGAFILKGDGWAKDGYACERGEK